MLHILSPSTLSLEICTSISLTLYMSSLIAKCLTVIFHQSAAHSHSKLSKKEKKGGGGFRFCSVISAAQNFSTLKTNLKKMHTPAKRTIMLVDTALHTRLIVQSQLLLQGKENLLEGQKIIQDRQFNSAHHTRLLSTSSIDHIRKKCICHNLQMH